MIEQICKKKKCYNAGRPTLSANFCSAYLWNYTVVQKYWVFAIVNCDFYISISFIYTQCKKQVWIAKKLQQIFLDYFLTFLVCNMKNSMNHEKIEPSQLTVNQRFCHGDFVTKWGFKQEGSGDCKIFLWSPFSANRRHLVRGQFVCVQLSRTLKRLICCKRYILISVIRANDLSVW